MGCGVPTFLLIFAGFQQFISAGMNVIFYGLWPHKVPHFVANGLALFLLLLLYLAWIVAWGRRWVTSATGAGFSIAATALIMRTTCELCLGLLWRSADPEIPDEPLTAFLIRFARDGGAVAYAVGLAFVLGACLAERRFAREARTPRRSGEAPPDLAPPRHTN